MAVAFFDLDRTVLSVNSATGWLRREVRLGFVNRRTALRASWSVVKYQVGAANLEDAVRSAIASLEGDEEAAIRARTRAFWEEEVVQTIRPGARAAMAEHKAAGEEVVLLTSSSSYMSELAAEALPLDAWLCNRFEVVDGRFTGASAVEPLCFGAGKVHHAREYAAARGVQLADCAFYTDSMSDAPLLEVVGRPVVVDPDPRLARLARRRGWALVDWDQDPA